MMIFRAVFGTLKKLKKLEKKMLTLYTFFARITFAVG